jgi:hypothetical protein
MDDHGEGILGKRDATGQEIADAMGYAFREAAREYKRAGIPIATWDWDRNEVVIVPPEEIAIPEKDHSLGESLEARDGKKG